ncbi:hypothetical protein ASG63_20475 [Methylobacterium sp. Leaf94]|uniref:hypothetical protein n=1 Tax=Methylobacterium sp. Leaf94 TaxID=1736250 RepID=UPI0007017509|nr:hypothetical protein [Methylobacterium sp. Leaf94]KQU25552.1 hypothetical protein ASG63_20475 [Methylobacterium sp. Leaf94]
MTKLYKQTDSGLVAISPGKLTSEDLIEGWVAANPGLLGLDVLVIGRQVITDHNGRIDLLGIDGDGNLAVVELKRGLTPREIVAQVLDYASWVAALSTSDVHALALKYLKRPLELAFAERFGDAVPERLNASHTMVIVASALDPSSQRIVRYLSQVHGVGINTAFFTIFEHCGERLLTTDWLLDQEEVVARTESKVRAPWQGLWYVNVGQSEHRNWQDMQRYGFVAAGGGTRWSGPLTNLAPGLPIAAYQKGAGYVGYGIVTAGPVMARDFVTETGPLLEQELVEPGLSRDLDDPERAEYVVAVDWQRTFSVPEARSFPGAFANQHVVCRLRDPATVEFLQQQFGFALPNAAL